MKILKNNSSKSMGDDISKGTVGGAGLKERSFDIVDEKHNQIFRSRRC